MPLVPSPARCQPRNGARMNALPVLVAADSGPGDASRVLGPGSVIFAWYVGRFALRLFLPMRSDCDCSRPSRSRYGSTATPPVPVTRNHLRWVSPSTLTPAAEASCARASFACLLNPREDLASFAIDACTRTRQSFAWLAPSRWSLRTLGLPSVGRIGLRLCGRSGVSEPGAS